MTWDDVWMIIGAVIMSCGGAGVIIVGCSSFLANMIEKRLEAKYKQMLDKELESYKHTTSTIGLYYRRAIAELEDPPDLIG